MGPNKPIKNNVWNNQISSVFQSKIMPTIEICHSSTPPQSCTWAEKLCTENQIHKSLFISNYLGTVNKAYEGEDDSMKDHHASFSELPNSLKFTQDPIVQNAINRKLSTRRPQPAAAEDNKNCGSSDNVATTPNCDQCKDSENTIADVKLWWTGSWCLNDISSRTTSNKSLWFFDDCNDDVKQPPLPQIELPSHVVIIGEATPRRQALLNFTHFLQLWRHEVQDKYSVRNSRFDSFDEKIQCLVHVVHAIRIVLRIANSCPLILIRYYEHPSYHLCAPSGYLLFCYSDCTDFIF